MFLSKSIFMSFKSKCFVNSVRNMNYSTNSVNKSIEFKTCGQLFEKLKKTNPRLYKNSPSHGLTVTVDYVDTYDHKKYENCGNVKTVVAIHGVPGYYQHFNELIDFFSDKDSNVRLIVPNIPDFTLTRKTMAFWHSSQERSQLIRDFLKAINVSTIDCLISHSAGIHPISMIWSEPKELLVKSVGLFCPQPLWMSKYFFNLFSNFAKYKSGIKLMDVIKPHLIMRRLGYPMSFANVDEVMLIFLIGLPGLEEQGLHQRLEYLNKNKIKTLVVYGERDKLIVKTNFKQLVVDLAADQRDFVIYSEDNLIEKDSERENSVKILSFRSGGHFCFAKYSKEVNQQLVEHCLKS